MCFRGEGKLTQALLISRRLTLAYCVSAVQSSTMVGDPSRVRYVTVDIYSLVTCAERGGSTGQGDLRVHVDADVVDQRLVCKKSKMPCNATTARWQPQEIKDAVQRHNRTLAAHLCPSETRCSASVASDVAHNTRHTLHAGTWLLPCLT